MKHGRFGVLALVVLVSGGCGSPSHEDLVKEQIRSLEEAANLLTGLADADTAATARPKLKKILQRIEDQNERGRKLPELSPEAFTELDQKYQPASQAALKRLYEAAKTARRRPGCEEVVVQFLRDLEGLTPTKL